MGSYIPATPTGHSAMLQSLGMASYEDLFKIIPKHLRCGKLNLPPGKSELEVSRIMQGLAAENKVFPTVFRGAGAYRHYIPSIVKQVAAKETFVTSYTPYQAEISQGMLQIIFEYQSEICALTGMDVSNASIYDGPSAAAEAAAMCRERKRQQVLVAASAHPDSIETIQTYCTSADAPVVVIPHKQGKLDKTALQASLNETVACLYLQSPNFYGQIEDIRDIAELCHNAGVKLIQGCNPIALALMETPAECGADIAVGEGQPLGMPLGFGGPYLGFMACKKEMMRRLPGRIVGQTTDADGKRCFVLTLQAREQHIRREKALSSVCSNQALCALTASVYMAAMGPLGMAEAARQCYSKAHYAAAELAKIGFSLVFSGEFFHEFVTTCPVNQDALLCHLEKNGILGALPVENGLLWCFTEINTKQEIDTLVALCREVPAE